MWRVPTSPFQAPWISNSWIPPTPTSTGNFNTTVAASAGTASATASGAATVTGSGTNSLSISGSLADVNATLNSLTYTNSTTGAASLVVTARDSAGT
ncbi:MAG: hypothetical protein EBQ87_03240, partial [Planctomycetes bacterium]|nr:hypothetical protein [Planctomycetota bacterium]